MIEKLKTPIIDLSAWKKTDIERDNSWLIEFEEDEVNEMRQALEAVKKSKLSIVDVKKDNFQLKKVIATLQRAIETVEEKRGFVVLRGIPAGEFSVPDIELLYSGITAYIGNRIVQDTEGTLIDHVCDRGLSYDNIDVRGYTTSAKLTPHCDSGDILSLFCVRPAKEGGMNTLSSSMSIYNAILAEHPEFLDVLYRGFYFNIRGNGPPGQYVNVTKHRVPIYCYYANKLSCRYNEKAIKTAAELPGIEPLGEIELAAIDFIAKKATDQEYGFDLFLKTGDILLINNHMVFHTRDSFVDDEAIEKKRLLLRQWVNLHNGRPLLEKFADHYNTGAKQGPFVSKR